METQLLPLDFITQQETLLPTWCYHVNIYFQGTLHYLLYCYGSQPSSFLSEWADQEQRAERQSQTLSILKQRQKRRLLDAGAISLRLGSRREREVFHSLNSSCGRQAQVSDGSGS